MWDIIERYDLRYFMKAPPYYASLFKVIKTVVFFLLWTIILVFSLILIFQGQAHCLFFVLFTYLFILKTCICFRCFFIRSMVYSTTENWFSFQSIFASHNTSWMSFSYEIQYNNTTYYIEYILGPDDGEKLQIT